MSRRGLIVRGAVAALAVGSLTACGDDDDASAPGGSTTTFTITTPSVISFDLCETLPALDGCEDGFIGLDDISDGATAASEVAEGLFEERFGGRPPPAGAVDDLASELDAASLGRPARSFLDDVLRALRRLISAA